MAEALQALPVVLLVGPRQAGKSTIAHRFFRTRVRSFVTLDDALTLEEAKRDSDGFIAGLELPVIIDEVQRVPSLLLAIKARVDRERMRSPASMNGSFLLTGSANVLFLSDVADSLAGRMATVTVWPFAQSEMEALPGAFIDMLFAEKPVWRWEESSSEIAERLTRGGYPASFFARTEEERKAFLGSLVTSLLERDIRAIAQVEEVYQFQRLLRILSTRPASLLNVAGLSGDVGIARTTLERYLRVLEAAYLTFRLPAWSMRATARESKAPKIYLVDSGLAAYESRLTPTRLREDPHAFGMLLENFVVSEILRQREWSNADVALFHYRSHDGRREADLVLEERGGRCVVLEIKASRMVRHEDIPGMAYLRDTLGDRFVRGVVLYQGSGRVSLGDRIEALPLSALWMS